MKKSYRIPWLPISALLFYLGAIFLWQIHLIPPPHEIISFLENLYRGYGLLGLSIATFLEGIVYLGLYFPGSFVIALSVFLSDGSFISLLSISITVAFTLTFTSLINYWLGKHVRFKHLNEEDLLFDPKQPSNKGLFFSCWHPNLLAFYFFDAGIEKKSFKKILYVPFFMIPIGLFSAYLLYSLKAFLIPQIEKFYIMIALLVIWFIIAFLFTNKRKLHLK
ncbi:hypothetical protein CMI42_05530 [Candidatus Pacearchaeota archaeon]|nr:hypothetical protein [Candidatus Pacearchaeota archaeon]